MAYEDRPESTCTEAVTTTVLYSESRSEHVHRRGQSVAPRSGAQRCVCLGKGLVVIRTISDAEAVDMELKDLGPLKPPVGKPLDGEMLTWGRNFFASDDARIHTGVWECAPGRLRADFGTDGEMVHVVKGSIHAISDDGVEILVGPGQSATFPPGWTGIWELATPMRKLYCTLELGEK